MEPERGSLAEACFWGTPLFGLLFKENTKRKAAILGEFPKKTDAQVVAGAFCCVRTQVTQAGHGGSPVRFLRSFKRLTVTQH